MFTESLNLLLVHGDPAAADRIEALLRRAPSGTLAMRRADSYDDGLSAIGDPSLDACLVTEAPGPRTAADLLPRLADKRRHGIPLVVLAAHAAPQHLLALVREGADDAFGIDEVTPPLLERLIHHAVERRRRRRDEAHHTEATLRERVKELALVTNTGRLINRRDLPIQERLNRIVNEIPSGWHDPERTEARLTLSDWTVATPGFRETPWLLSATIPTDDEPDGLLEVVLTANTTSGGAQDPFLPEEHDLVDNLARIIGETVARERASRKLEQTLASLDEAVVILDSIESQRRVRYVNPAGERMFGYTRDEFVGATPDMTHPDRASFEQFGEMARTQLQSGRSFRATFTLKRKDGSLFEAEQTVSLFDPEHGLGGGVVSVVRDVSRREQAEAALRESEERFRQIAEHVSDVFWITNPDKSRMEYVSPAYAKIWGRAPDELYADPGSWLDAIIPDDRERIAHESTRQPRGGYDVTYRIRRPDGAVRWIHDRAFPVTDDGGTVERLIGVAEDVTERRMAEERFRVLGEEMMDVIIVIAPDGRVLFASPSAEWLTGYPADELVGMSAFDIIQSEDHEVVGPLLGKVAQTPGETARAEFKMLRMDGTTRDVESVARNLMDHPAVRGIVTTTRDVTERLTLERRLRQVQKMEAVGRLAGGIAHDFNNILTVIRSETELLLLDNEGTDLADDLEVIRSEADRAATLTNHLLAFSREQVLRPRRLDLGSVVRDMAEPIDETVGDAITVEYDLSPDVESVLVDPEQLEQVVLNIVANARDASPKGGVVTISTADERISLDDVVDLPGLTPGRYTRLSIADTGSGMSPETARRIFDPFFSTKPAGRGTGLGLAMAYGFMKQSGGGIHVDSREGHGSTFHLRFPVAGQLEAPSAPGQAAPQAANSSPAPEVEPDSPNEPQSDAHANAEAPQPTILVVDDEAGVRRVTKRVLDRGGFQVHAVEDAASALAALESDRPIDLLLTDVRLPGESGGLLAERARTLRPHLPIIVMSGFAGGSDGTAANLPEGVGYLAKPFTRAVLLDAIRAALREKREGRLRNEQ